MDGPILYTVIATLILLLLVVFLIRLRHKKVETDYRTLFIIGVIWIPLGISTGNPGLWGMGLVMMIAGAVNKDKWKEPQRWADLPAEQKKVKVVLIGVLLLTVSAGIFTWLYYANQGG